LLLEELHIVAEDFPEARRVLGDLALSDEADARALTLMAAIERGEGGADSVVQGWLARALAAPRGPQWVCDNCHHIHSEWQPVCESCQSLDTLSWTAPPRSEIVSATGVHMLPLIVKESETPEAETPTEEPKLVEEVEEDTGDGEAETVEAKAEEVKPA